MSADTASAAAPAAEPQPLPAAVRTALEAALDFLPTAEWWDPIKAKLDPGLLAREWPAIRAEEWATDQQARARARGEDLGAKGNPRNPWTVEMALHKWGETFVGLAAAIDAADFWRADGDGPDPIPQEVLAVLQSEYRSEDREHYLAHQAETLLYLARRVSRGVQTRERHRAGEAVTPEALAGAVRDAMNGREQVRALLHDLIYNRVDICDGFRAAMPKAVGKVVTPTGRKAPAKRHEKTPPGKDRQEEIVAAIRDARRPLTMKEIRGAIGLKNTGALPHNLSWMVKNQILEHIAGDGYWPVRDPLPGHMTGHV
jgi:hypothetical protein